MKCFFDRLFKFTVLDDFTGGSNGDPLPDDQDVNDPPANDDIPPEDGNANDPPSDDDVPPPHFLDQYKEDERYADLITDRDRERYKDPIEAIRAHKDLEKMVRQKGFVPPGEGATEEEIAAYRKNIGVPDSAESYEDFEIPESLQEEIYPEDITALKQAAHEMGLPPQSFGVLSEKFLAMHQARVEAHKELSSQEKSQTIEALQSEWGSDYETNMKEIAEFIESPTGLEMEFPGIAKEIIQSGLGAGRQVLRLLHKYRQQTLNDKSMTNHANRQSATTELESIRQRMTEDLPPSERKSLQKREFQLVKQLG